MSRAGHRHRMMKTVMITWAAMALERSVTVFHPQCTVSEKIMLLLQIWNDDQLQTCSSMTKDDSGG